MKQVYVLRHVPHEHLGSIAAGLTHRQRPFAYFDLAGSEDAVVDLDRAAGLIVMGGPMSANDPFPYIRRELYLIADALQRNFPVLGVCLGSQLIAAATGARVYRNPVKEIGWYPVYRTPEASSDPLLRWFSDKETVFHWHGETFDLPAGAVWLARSDLCAHQAFRLGRRTYGFQFHFEVTPDMIAEWCRQDEACGDQRETTGPIDPHAHADRMAALSDRVVSEWLALLDVEQA